MSERTGGVPGHRGSARHIVGEGASRQARQERVLLLGLLAAVVVALGAVIGAGVYTLDAARTAQQVEVTYQGAHAAADHLEAYALTGQEAFFRRYEQNLAPLRAAGEAYRALQAPAADWERVAALLVESGATPESAAGVVHLARLLADTRIGQELLGAWAEADRQVERIGSAGERLRVAVEAGGEEAYVASLLHEVQDARAELHRLGPQFYDAVGRLVLSVKGAVHGSVLLGAFLILLAAWALASRLLRRMAHSEERFRATFENAAVGVAHVSVDGTILRVNDRLCEIVGYAREELLRRSFKDLTHPDDLEPDLAQIRRLVAGEISSYALEKRYLHRDGRPVWTHLTVSAMRDPGGEVRLIRIVEDIGEKKAAEGLLRESEERFRQLAEHMESVIWMLDGETRQLLYVNASFEEVWGISREEACADIQALVRRVHEGDRARFEATLSGPVERKVELEIRVTRADGALRWLRIVGFPVRDEHGRVYRIAGITEDVTDRVLFEREREARARAEEVLRVKTAFLRNVSHEMRTPLTTILGFASLLREGASTAEQRDHAEIVERNAKALAETVGRVLDLAQLESGALVTWPEEVDFVAEVREAVNHLRPIARLKNLALEAAGSEDALPGRVDRACLQRILALLIGNGVKSTEAGGVYVWVEGHAGEVVVRVRDTGVGINPALLPHFVGADARSYTRARAEMELDLDLVRRLADALGGVTSVESEPGRGTIFTLRLPRQAVRPTPVAVSGDGWIAGGPGGAPAAGEEPGADVVLWSALAQPAEDEPGA